jgi:outer membrane lipoprotein SlyB
MSQNSHEKPVNRPTASNDAESSCTAWGALAGGAFGLIVSAFAGHPWGWILGAGVIGAVVGALVDRHRR